MILKLPPPAPPSKPSSTRRRSAAVISLSERQRLREAEGHARALVLHAGAVRLARAEHPELVRLLERCFGPDWLRTQVRRSLDAVPAASPQPVTRGVKRRRG